MRTLRSKYIIMWNFIKKKTSRKYYREKECTKCLVERRKIEEEKAHYAPALRFLKKIKYYKCSNIEITACLNINYNTSTSIIYLYLYIKRIISLMLITFQSEKKISFLFFCILGFVVFSDPFFFYMLFCHIYQWKYS